MSRPFREKNKDLVKLEVVTSDKVWTKTNRVNRNFVRISLSMGVWIKERARS